MGKAFPVGRTITMSSEPRLRTLEERERTCVPDLVEVLSTEEICSSGAGRSIRPAPLGQGPLRAQPRAETMHAMPPIMHVVLVFECARAQPHL